MNQQQRLPIDDGAFPAELVLLPALISGLIWVCVVIAALPTR